MLSDLELQMKDMETTLRVLGHEHPSTLSSMANLASTYRNQGRCKEAEELFVKVLETRKRVLGQEHPSTLTSIASLAYTWKSQGRVAEAIAMLAQAVNSYSSVFGNDHPYCRAWMSTLKRWTGEKQKGAWMISPSVLLKRYIFAIGKAEERKWLL